MAITVTPDLTLISDCDAIGSWLPAPVLDTDYQVQGNGCMADQVKATTGPLQLWTFGAAQDMNGKHIYIWMMVTGVPDTKANGGFRIYAEDNAGHFGTWYVGGKDTHPGGWGCFVIDPASTYTNGSGTIDVSNILKIGVQFKTLTSAIGKINNCFWDVCRYGSGLTVKSGVADAITFEKIFIEDDLSANKYGVVTKAGGGTFIVQGLLTLQDIDFTDKNQVVIFPDNEFVSDAFYGIKVQHDIAITNFTLGEKSGVAGIKGCLLKAPGAKTFSLDVSNADNDKIQLYGTTFNNAGTITLPPDAANREVLNCNFEACAEVLVDTCIVKNCNFIAADDRGIRIASASHHVTYCNFISCGHSIHINFSDVVGFLNLKFSGSNGTDKWDIEHSAAGTLTINCTDSDPNENYVDETGGGTTNIVNTVPLTVQGVKTGEEPTNHVRCRIETDPSKVEIMNKEATVSYNGYYKATKDFNYPGSPQNVIIKARYKGYLPFETKGTITDKGLTVTAVWLEDPNYT